ncbi:MAG UNVERIFIED_CONTAM: hypothetical protein LVR29_02305 [Microcystis novacekii LVE1205-3]
MERSYIFVNLLMSRQELNEENIPINTCSASNDLVFRYDNAPHHQELNLPNYPS